MRKAPTALLTCMLVLGGLLSACGGSDDKSTGDSKPLVITATINGNDLTPNGERLKVGVNQPITINLTADRDGELHVHSSPEQHLPYKTGTTTFHLKFDTPGIIEIEDHIADKTLVSLEVD